MEFIRDPKWNHLKESAGARSHWGEFYTSDGPIEVGLSDPRWDAPSTPWTDRDNALCEYAYNQLVSHAWPFRSEQSLLFAAILEWAKEHEDYQVWLGGELIK